MLTRVFGRRKNMWGLVIHTRLHAPTAGGDARKCVLRTTRLDAALSSIPTRIMPNREEESCVPGAQWFFCFRNPRARNLNEAPIPFQPAPSHRTKSLLNWDFGEGNVFAATTRAPNTHFFQMRPTLVVARGTAVGGGRVKPQLP